MTATLRCWGGPLDGDEVLWDGSGDVVYVDDAAVVELDDDVPWSPPTTTVVPFPAAYVVRKFGALLGPPGLTVDELLATATRWSAFALVYEPTHDLEVARITAGLRFVLWLTTGRTWTREPAA